MADLAHSSALNQSTNHMTPTDIHSANATLATQSPLDVVRWAVARANGRALVSTNFRP